MDAADVKEGAVIAPKWDKERLYKIDCVFSRHGKLWVRLRYWQACYMSIELYEVLNNYVLCFGEGENGVGIRSSFRDG